MHSLSDEYILLITIIIFDGQTLGHLPNQTNQCIHSNELIHLDLKMRLSS